MNSILKWWQRRRHVDDDVFAHAVWGRSDIDPLLLLFQQTFCNSHFFSQFLYI